MQTTPVWACGDNSDGQLGIGDGKDQSTIVPVEDGAQTPGVSYFLENIVFVDGGFMHSPAVDRDAYVWAWGYGDT